MPSRVLFFQAGFSYELAYFDNPDTYLPSTAVSWVTNAGKRRPLLLYYSSLTDLCMYCTLFFPSVSYSRLSQKDSLCSTTKKQGLTAAQAISLPLLLLLLQQSQAAQLSQVTNYSTDTTQSPIPQVYNTSIMIITIRT